MGGVALLLWYLLMLAVQFGPLGWLIWRWDRQDRARLQATIDGGVPAKLSPRDVAIRVGLAVVAVAIMLPLTAPMYRATQSLSIALGQGYPA